MHDLPRALLIERYLWVGGSSFSTNYAIIPTLFSLLFVILLSLNLVYYPISIKCGPHVVANFEEALHLAIFIITLLAREILSCMDNDVK